MLAWLDVFTIVASGWMIGNELAVAVFVHPTLSRLEDEPHIRSASALARILGRWMPFWYGLVLLLLLLDAVLRHHASGVWPLPIVIAAGLWALAIVITVAVLVPINNRIGGWTPSVPPAAWKNDRRRWDGLHRWRVVLLATAFLLFLVAVLRHPLT